LQSAAQQYVLVGRRRRTLEQISRARGATVITLIHRQETMSLLGFPLVRYIDIDDAESTLLAIRATPKGQPIEIILHTPAVSSSLRVRSRPRSPTTTAPSRQSFPTTR
jgi:ClpP class serine protease